jgi:hypothetical protein
MIASVARAGLEKIKSRPVDGTADGSELQHAAQIGKLGITHLSVAVVYPIVIVNDEEDFGRPQRPHHHLSRMDAIPEFAKAPQQVGHEA